MIDFHLIPDGELCQVCKLVLEDRLVHREGKSRYLMEVRGTNDWGSMDKSRFEINALKHTKVIHIFLFQHLVFLMAEGERSRLELAKLRFMDTKWEN